MKYAADLDAFLRDVVNLNNDRLARLQKRVDAVENFIANDETFGNMFIDVIPAGSWAQRSIIKPVKSHDTFDADVLLALVENEDWEAKDYIENLYSRLSSSSVYSGIIRKKKRCVRVDYADEFHIDLVPRIERSGRNFITNSEEPEETGSFELSNPEEFTEWAHDRQLATRGQFVKIVRLMKYLRDHKDRFSCKSIILTTLLGEQVNLLEASLDSRLYADTPTTFVVLLEALADRLPIQMPAVMDPGGTGDNFTDRYKDDWNYDNFRKWIKYYATKARGAYNEKDSDESVKLWRELLGEKFKTGETLTKSAVAPLSASVPVSDEQFIDRPPLAFPWTETAGYSARISARCTGLSVNDRTTRKGFQQFSLPRRGNRVPKNRNLRFELKTDVPAPFDVYWKVRNGGSEAAAANKLRGEIRPDDGKLILTETTSYTGTHYVEAYVVKDGIVVARAFHPVIVTS